MIVLKHTYLIKAVQIFPLNFCYVKNIEKYFNWL